MLVTVAIARLNLVLKASYWLLILEQKQTGGLGVFLALPLYGHKSWVNSFHLSLYLSLPFLLCLRLFFPFMQCLFLSFFYLLHSFSSHTLFITLTRISLALSELSLSLVSPLSLFLSLSLSLTLNSLSPPLSHSLSLSHSVVYSVQSRCEPLLHSDQQYGVSQRWEPLFHLTWVLQQQGSCHLLHCHLHHHHHTQLHPGEQGQRDHR